MKTLIIIPTYNEAENITRIIPAVFQNLPDANVLVVDDGSPDGTAGLVKDLIQNDKRVHLLQREGKNGLALAYIAGFRWGMEKGFEILSEFDADFSHNPEYLPSMVDSIIQGADYVVGSRYVRGGGVEGWGLSRKIISRGGSLYARMILGGRIKDLTGGYNIWNTEVLKKMPFDDFIATGYLFQIEMKHRARKMGFRGSEFPIVFIDRVEGVSKMSGGIFKEALKDVWKIRWAVK